uniref:ER lumen protein-retaining receptor n=1 Tax=Arcella intermedia TaxID=1963864 RepID=A0A6B2LHC1_9EUKA
MNYFRIAGDLLHLFSFAVLLVKIYNQKSCRGISLQTQILYLIVFVSRYLDLPWNIMHFTWFSLYLAAMKIIFIASTGFVIYMVKVKYGKSYSKDEDTFPTWWLVVPCLLLSLVWNEEFSFFEVLWAFSIYLEAVSILPQLVLLQKTGNVETLTGHYIFCLGGYRALYLLNWIYRYTMEDDYSQWIVWVSGTIQTILYVDFFYYYIVSYIKGTQVVLPTSV